jgi:hypothetical protein
MAGKEKYNLLKEDHEIFYSCFLLKIVLFLGISNQ